MKNLSQSMKKSFQYSLCILAITIFTFQVYQIINEEHITDASKEITDEVFLNAINSLPIVQNVNNEKCEKSHFSLSSIFLCLFRCAVAFLFGGMISEMRYIKLGTI